MALPTCLLFVFVSSGDTHFTIDPMINFFSVLSLALPQSHYLHAAHARQPTRNHTQDSFCRNPWCHLPTMGSLCLIVMLCVCVYVHARAHVCTCVCVHMYVCLCACMHVCSHAWVHAWACMYACQGKYKHVCKHTHNTCRWIHLGFYDNK